MSVLRLHVNGMGKYFPSSMLCRMSCLATFIPRPIPEYAHTGRYKYLNIFIKKHHAEFGRLISKNSGAHTGANSRSFSK